MLALTFIGALCASSPALAHEEEQDQAAQAWTVAAPVETTASTTRVEHEQLETSVAKSAEDYLRLIPGLFIVQHGSEGKGHQLYLRGFDAGHGSDVEVSLEGITLNEPSNIHAHGYLDFSFIIPEAVYAIDAIKGPFDVRQGDFATAGSVQYRLGVPKDKRGLSLQYQLGTTNRHRFMAIYAPKRLAIPELLAVEAVTDQGYGQARSLDRLSALGQRRLHLGPGLHLDLLGALYFSQFGMPGALRLGDYERGAVGFYDAYSTLGLGQSQRALLSAKLTRKLNAKQRFSLRAHLQHRKIALRENFTGFLIDPQQGDLRSQQQSGLSGGLALEYQHKLKPWLRAEAAAGLNLYDQTAKEQQLDQQLNPVLDRQDHDLRRNHLYTTLALRGSPLSWLAIEAGARVDAFDDQIESRVDRGGKQRATQWTASPRLTARAFPTEQLTIFSSIGQGLRSSETRALLQLAQQQADADQRLYRGGSPKLTKSNSAELGLSWRPLNPLPVDLNLAGFGSWIAREAVYDHVSGVNLELNGTRRLGVELGADVSLKPWLKLGADLTLVQARFVESGNPVPGVPTNLLTAHAQLDHPSGFSAGLQWILLGARTLAHGATASPSHLGLASLGWRWRDLALNLQVENLLNDQVRTGEYSYASWWDQDQPKSQLPTIHYVTAPPLNARLGLRLFF